MGEWYSLSAGIYGAFSNIKHLGNSKNRTKVDFSPVFLLLKIHEIVLYIPKEACHIFLETVWKNIVDLHTQRNRR